MYASSTLEHQEFHDAGYKLLRFTSTEYTIEKHQTIFTREGVITMTELPYSFIWPHVKTREVISKYTPGVQVSV